MTIALSLRLYAGVMAALSPFARIALNSRAQRGKEDPGRLGERLGHAAKPRPAGPLAWLHGASMGEGLSLLPLAAHIAATRPATAVLITTATRASADVLAARVPPGVLHQYSPIDTPRAVSRFLHHWRPDLAVFAESELWPNLILETRRSGAGMALVSARISDASVWRWGRIPGAARAILGSFDLILARDEAAALQLRGLGAEIGGLADLKFGGTPLPAEAAELGALAATLGERPVVFAASTHPGEELLILQSLARVRRQGFAGVLIVAPRHAERGEEIAALARDFDFRASRRGAGGSFADVDVFVADTLGELGLWYRLARLAILGGSLVENIGGHNPLEPARLDCPFVSGRLVSAWPLYLDFERRGATALVRDPRDLDRWLGAAFSGDPQLVQMAQAARALAEAGDRRSRAAHERIVQLLGS